MVTCKGLGVLPHPQIVLPACQLASLSSVLASPAGKACRIAGGEGSGQALVCRVAWQVAEAAVGAEVAAEVAARSPGEAALGLFIKVGGCERG